jgi:hypothetical protein
MQASSLRVPSEYKKQEIEYIREEQTTQLREDGGDEGGKESRGGKGSVAMGRAKVKIYTQPSTSSSALFILRLSIFGSPLPYVSGLVLFQRLSHTFTD